MFSLKHGGRLARTHSQARALSLARVQPDLKARLSPRPVPYCLSTAGSRLLANRLYSTPPSDDATSSALASNLASLNSSATPEGEEPRLQMTFTCTAENCNHRSTHTFSKRSYEHGIVLIQCPNCKNRHLIADHIGWFKEGTEEGKYRTVEDLLRARGEKVRRGRLDVGGVIEYAEE